MASHKSWILIWDLDKTLAWDYNQPFDISKPKEANMTLNPGAVDFLKKAIQIRDKKANNRGLIKYIFLLTNHSSRPYINQAVDYISESIGSPDVFDAIMYFNSGPSDRPGPSSVPLEALFYKSGPRRLPRNAVDDDRAQRLKGIDDIVTLLNFTEKSTDNTFETVVDRYKILFFDDYPGHELTDQIAGGIIQGKYVQISPPFENTLTRTYSDGVNWNSIVMDGGLRRRLSRKKRQKRRGTFRRQ
ncbi:MAG: hypothetical protein EBY22_17595 [Gammaproteobacteria bacterium]|nr:hypothetical protein [Gammaproteobacteria bacterium]